MIFKGYTIEPRYTKDGKLVWKGTGNGSVIVGKKDGKKWRIKQNDGVKLGNAKDYASKGYYKSLEAIWNYYEAKQNKIRDLMKGLSFDVDKIIKEEAYFKNEETNKYVTVMRYVDVILPNDYEYHKESIQVKRELLKRMALQIKKIHDCGVIHGDLKDVNFMFAKEGDYIISYLTDFDSSYPRNAVPNIDNEEESSFFMSSEGWESPEIIVYTQSEDGDNRTMITPATDVYTLGLIFHWIFAGYPPVSPVENASVARAQLHKKEISLSDSLDVMIGSKNNATFKSLVNWMIQCDYNKRPTIDQVLAVLNDEAFVDPAYVAGKDILAFMGLHKDHEKLATIDYEVMKSKGISSFKQIPSRGDGMSKYVVKIGDEELTYKLHDLVLKEYITPVDKEFKMMDGDSIDVYSPDILHLLGYAWIETTAKGYTIVPYAGSPIPNAKGTDLIRLGLAVKKGDSKRTKEEVLSDLSRIISDIGYDDKVILCEPADADEIEFAFKSYLFNTKKIASIDLIEVGKYMVTKLNGISYKATVDQLLSMGLAKKKNVVITSAYEEPHPEDCIQYVAEEKLREMRITSIRVLQKNKYQITRGSLKYTWTSKELVMNQCAIYLAASSSSAYEGPDPEDNIVYDIEKLKVKVSSIKLNKGATKKYELVLLGMTRSFTAEELIGMKYAKRK